MPNFSAKIALLFTSNSKKITKDVKKDLGELNNSLDKSRKSFLGLGNGAAIASKIGIAAFIAAGTRAVIVGSKFQEELKDLEAITGLSGAGLEMLSAAALEMSSKYGLAAADILNTTKIVASANSELLDQPDALRSVTEQVVILSKAARLDLKTTAEALTDSMNQFGLGSDQAARAINVLAAGAKVGASEVANTAKAIVRSGVAAREAGLDFEQTNATLQVLAKNGLKGEMAGNQLKTTLLKLATKGIDAINPKIVGYNTALDNLAAANLSAKDLTELFGEEAFTVGKIMISNRGLIKQWTNEITGTTIANEQASKNMEGFRQAVAKLGATIDEKLIKIFTALEPKITSFISNLTKAVNAVDELTSSTGQENREALNELFSPGRNQNIIDFASEVRRQQQKGKSLKQAKEAAAADFGFDSFSDVPERLKYLLPPERSDSLKERQRLERQRVDAERQQQIKTQIQTQTVAPVVNLTLVTEDGKFKKLQTDPNDKVNFVEKRSATGLTSPVGAQ